MWKITVSKAEVLGVHAALLPTGHIIYFTGNQYDINEQATNQFDHTRLYDCATDHLVHITWPFAEDDVFCCGHAMLPSGWLLIAGGSEHLIRDKQGTPTTEPGIHHGIHVPGIRKAFIFDPFAQKWFSTADMSDGPVDTSEFTPVDTSEFTPLDISGFTPYTKQMLTGGRWYPTLITLPSGKVMAFGGHPGSGDARHHNNVAEVYDEASGRWRRDDPNKALNKDTNLVVDTATYYPRLHVLPTGDVFCSTLLNGDDGGPDWYMYQPGQGTSSGVWVRTKAASIEIDKLDLNYGNVNNNYRMSAVLLPLLPEKEYQASVLLCGSKSGLIITPQQTNIGKWNISVAHTKERQLEGERRECNAVILPTGQVFVCGGVNAEWKEKWDILYPPETTEIPDALSVLQAELYSPESNSWQTLEPASVTRNYHSVALLMPDGRVWTAGSSKNGAHTGDWQSEIEIYSPWYCDRSDRPEITDVSHSALSSDTLLIKTPQDDIERVAILRTGSVTHCFNSDQRYIGLKFSRDNNGVLLAQIPPSNIAISGYYLLFLINKKGVPSKGTFIHTSHSQFSEPKQSILFSLFGDILEVLPSGQFKRVPPGDPPLRDMLVGLAIYELAKNIEDAQERVTVQKASLNLVSNIANKTLGSI